MLFPDLSPETQRELAERELLRPYMSILQELLETRSPEAARQRVDLLLRASPELSELEKVETALRGACEQRCGDLDAGDVRFTTQTGQLPSEEELRSFVEVGAGDLPGVREGDTALDSYGRGYLALNTLHNRAALERTWEEVAKQYEDRMNHVPGFRNHLYEARRKRDVALREGWRGPTMEDRREAEPDREVEPAQKGRRAARSR